MFARKLILIPMLIILAACTGEAGRGPIELSYPVAIFFEEYKKNSSLGYFYVTDDGHYAVKMTSHGSGMIGSGYLTDCSVDAGRRCWVFARSSKIVWEGPVTYQSFENYIPYAWCDSKAKNNLICLEFAEQDHARCFKGPLFIRNREFNPSYNLCRVKKLTEH